MKRLNDLKIGEPLFIVVIFNANVIIKEEKITSISRNTEMYSHLYINKSEIGEEGDNGDSHTQEVANSSCDYIFVCSTKQAAKNKAMSLFDELIKKQQDYLVRISRDTIAAIDKLQEAKYKNDIYD